MSDKNLLDDLKSVKLRKPSQPMRDFSDPKLTGFLCKNEVDAYKANVLECNIENWYELLGPTTFMTKFCEITMQEGLLFIQIYERLFRNKDLTDLVKIDWRGLLTSDEVELLNLMEARLDQVIKGALKDENGFVFVKTSSRSAKDSPMASENFKILYKLFLNESKNPNEENEQIICLLKAAFDSLKVRNSREAIEMFIKSERIYQDMLLAVEKNVGFKENFVVREFVHIDIDMEFRGFVYNGKLTALSQYNYLIFSQRLIDNKEIIEKLIQNFFNQNVWPKLNDKFSSCFVIDFAVFALSKVLVIELNPFLETTDGALFSWNYERQILEGNGEANNLIVFRITEKPRIGSKSMLPYNLKKIIENV